jgi:hypothetical protein
MGHAAALILLAFLRLAALANPGATVVAVAAALAPDVDAAEFVELQPRFLALLALLGLKPRQGIAQRPQTEDRYRAA